MDFSGGCALQTKQAKKRCRPYRSLFFRNEYRIVKIAHIASGTRSEDQFLYAKVQFILVPPPLSASAPLLRLLWRRHCILYCVLSKKNVYRYRGVLYRVSQTPRIRAPCGFYLHGVMGASNFACGMLFTKSFQKN